MDVAMATDFVQKWDKITYPLHLSLSIQNRMGYRYVNGHVNSANDACILCDNFVKFAPVTTELTGLICERLV